MLDVWSLLPFGTRRITTMKVVFGNSGKLPLAFLPARCAKSIAGCLLPCLPFFLASRTSVRGRFCSRLKMFRWEPNGGSTRCAGNLSWSSGSRRGRPNDWIVSRRCWRHSRCAWRWRPMSCELLRGQHSRSTISSLVDMVSLPRWPITRISLGCTRTWLWAWCHVEWNLVVELESAWKGWLRRRITVPWWWRWRWIKLICRLPELGVFAWCISRIIIWCSHIVIGALLWAIQPTCWSHIGCLRRRSICRHRMWTKDGRNQIINPIGDFEWSGVGWEYWRYQRPLAEWRRLISILVVTNCVVSLRLWSHETRLRKRNHNHTLPSYLCYMLHFVL